jgi:cytidyltransferase-like protein
MADGVGGTTEGWLELFLTPSEKHEFSNWKEEVEDKSFTHKATANIFDKIAALLPAYIAPNLITLVGLCCLGQAWYICSKYGTEHPAFCTWFSIVNILIFFITNSVDSRHAARLKQNTSLGELFKYNVDCCSTVFLALLTTFCVGGTSFSTQWYAVQTAQLTLFTKHLSAFHRQAGIRYNVLTGPGEVLILIMGLLTIRAFFGLDFIVELYGVTVHQGVKFFGIYNLADGLPVTRAANHVLDKIIDPVELGAEAIKALYHLMYITAVVKALILPDPHGWSRFGISTSLLMRLSTPFLMHVGLDYAAGSFDAICDGLFMAVLTSDVTLAKMSGREIHPWVVLMSMGSILSNTAVLTLVGVYYIAVFGDICHYMNVPLLTVCKNVYCDGVYDLCHIGHKNLFKRALTFGNRLFVGVCGDKDCSNYKRPPIMTHDERCAEVRGCKAVTKVIENAPCFGITQEFIDEHQIHVVAFGQEYEERWPDPKDDIYYGHARMIGIAKSMPRTPGLSTSDLISRIQKSQPAGAKKSQT